MKRFWFFLICGAAALFSTAFSASAQCVSLTTAGSAYTQNFDTLSNTAGSTTNNLTITGWFMTESGGGARDNEQYAVDTGASTTGDTYSYGAAGSTERALGGLRSGTLAPLFGACFTNNTGSTLASLDIAYTGEEWRLGTAARTDQMNFEYSTNATDLSTGTWNGVSALNFVTPDTATTGAKNGNSAAARTSLSSSISSLSIANGATFWIRWTDTDASGADDGLAVDDFSLTPQGAAPLPSLSIDDVTQFEGNSGTTNFTFTVSLGSPAPAGGVTFDIATADGTATTADNDYVQKSLTGQTIPAGSSTYNFTVVVNGDHVVESDETFFVNVTNVTGATVGDGQGLGTIQNEDSTVQLQSSTLSTTEGSTFTFTITRTGYTGAAASVTFQTVSGTAIGSTSGCGVAGVDYATPPPSGINFAIGETSKTFTVTICDDTDAEPDETFQGEIISATGATFGTPISETVTILANDDATPPTVSYTPLANVATVQDQVFSVTATDNIGVTAVTVVWRNNGGGAGFVTNPCAFATGTAQNGTWTCTILSGIGPQTSPGTASYFVSADDAASNETTSPAGANVVGGTWNMYTIGTGGTIDVSIIDTFENVVLGDGFILGGNATVSGNLTLSGILNTGANKITLGCNASVTGAGETSYVVGSLEKVVCGTGSFVFPVGGPLAPPLAPEGFPVGSYSPLTANVTAGTVGSSLMVSVTGGFLADTDNTNSLSRYWDITETGDVTADLTFQYRPEDVNGNPANYLVLKREGGSTAWYPPGTVDTVNNRFTANGISDFSSWSAGLLAPTASNAAIEGRVRTSGGLGIRNATVVISGGGLGSPRTVQTGSFGYFRFDDLPVGETYVISVVSTRYVFANPTRLVTLDDNVIGLEFESLQ